MGKIDAKQVRIYKLNTFDCFTDEEDKIHNENKKRPRKEKMDLTATIKRRKKQRIVKRNRLYFDDGNENTWKQIAIFENDIVRLALGDREPDLQILLKEIVFMEIHHIDILEQIIHKGIKIDGVNYIFFSATTGQVRDNTITLIKKDFYDKHKNYLMVGLTEKSINKVGINIGKYLSYIALSLSASVYPESAIDIDKCIVVDGLKTKIDDLVKYVDIYVDIDESLRIADTPKEYINPPEPIEIEHTDGSGIFLPGKQASSFQIRGGHFKGAMFPFDFLEFAKEEAHNTVIKDAWNNDVDIVKGDIHYIFTTSQFKMWKYYKDWDDYKTKFKEHGIRFTINNWANPAKDKVRGNYQIFQTLPPGSEIKEICKQTVERLIKLHNNDLDFIRQEMQLSMNKRKQWEAHALEIYPELIYDGHIQKEIERIYKSELKKAKAGKIFIDGYYSYAAPDMYAFCEHLFIEKKRNNPDGLVLKNCVYNKYYSNNDDVTDVCLLRSPHLTKYEHPKRKLMKNDACNTWFEHMETDTVVSCHDMIAQSLMMDFDGDEILISSDTELLRLSNDTPPLYYRMETAPTGIISKDSIFKTLRDGFENNIIGLTSNAISKLWNQDVSDLNDVLKSLYPHDDLINVLCAYSNYSIDFPKTGKNITLGEYKADYKKLIDNKSKIKPPNFFIEAKGKSKKVVAKPNNSVVNRMKSHVIKETSGLKYEFPKGAFDYTLLMCKSHKNKIENFRYNKKYEETRFLLRELITLKDKYDKKISETIERKNTDGEDIILHFNLYHYVCTQKVNELFDGDMVLAANCIVDLIYFNHELGRSEVDSRIILWDTFGHILINNLIINKAEGKMSVTPRARRGYRKVFESCEVADKARRKVEDEHESRKVKITKKDYDFLIENLPRMKSGKYYTHDKEILFYLICLYKVFPRDKNEYMSIPKNSGRFVKQGKNKRKVRYKLFTLNKIVKIAADTSCTDSFNRFRKSKNISIKEDGSFYRLKLNLENSEQDPTIFTVDYFYKPTVFLTAYETGKPPERCICGKPFNKKGHTKTCSEKCAEELERRTTYIYNHSRKQN